MYHAFRTVSRILFYSGECDDRDLENISLKGVVMVKVASTEHLETSKNT